MALAVALSACQRREEVLTDTGPPSIVGRVLLLNADVMVVDGRHIRLSNAFAPEPIPRARCWAEALAAREALHRAQDMINAARTIDVKPTGGRDTFNRELAQVSLDGLDMGQTLLDQSLAARRPQVGRFEWCDPISKNDPNAPLLWPLARPDDSQG